ncbi:MAG: Ppx/GppA phosphatase family protein [Candidatus Humimicrobiaceae bacterium]
MNLAAIDIGTNSTRLLISSYVNGKFKTLIREMKITRIGKGIKDTGSISEDQALLTIKTLKKYKSLIDKFKVEKHLTVGTSALRRADNYNEFIKKTFNETAIKLEIISGLQEAAYSFNGAVKSLNLQQKIKIPPKVLVADIGGGSSEFILGDKYSNVLLIQSLDIGCVRASEDYLQSDPPQKQEIMLLNKIIKEKIEEALKDFKKYEDFIILGLAGTISSLASISLNLKKYKMEKINYLKLDLKKIKTIFENLSNLTIDERKKVTGLESERADVILGGIAIVIKVLEYFKKDKIIVGENDILDGIIYSLAIF